MGIDTYSVWYRATLLADGMSLGNAVLFVEALFQKYWQESCEYTIKKNEPTEDNACEVKP